MKNQTINKDNRQIIKDKITEHATNYLSFINVDATKANFHLSSLKMYLKACKSFNDVPNSYIGSINSSSKIEKNKTLNTYTLVVYLLPSTLSSFQVCGMASKGCISGCLNTSGRVIMDTKNKIQISRLIKTVLFFVNRNIFIDKLTREIQNAKKKAIKDNFEFSVRLNGTSDLNPLMFKGSDKVNLLDKFPNVQFYDYTKFYNRIEKLKKYSNYYITFSYSETNQEEIKQVLKTPTVIAVPFSVKKGQNLPTHYLGRKVIDADVTDLRYLDEPNTIAGLRVKLIKDKVKQAEALNSGFVVKA